MKISRLWVQVPVAAAALLGMAVACSSASSDPSGRREETAQARQAVVSEGLDFYTNFPSSGYVGTPSWIGSGIYYYPSCSPSSDGGIGGLPGTCDTPPPATDVTLTMTVTGNFASADFSFYGPPGFDCTETAAAGSLTVTCHTDSFNAYENGSFGLNITPATLGDVITETTTLTQGGELVRTETRDMTIVEPSADLVAWSWGGGTALLGQQSYASFFVGNFGPISAVNPKLTLTLTGPGTLNYVSVFTGTCTWTATTATCTAPSFPVFYGVPVQVGFTGDAVGQVSITASITSDTPDPYLDNNEATATFDVVQPKYADLAISMTDSPDPAKFGKPVTYTLKVTNKGPDAVEYPSVSDYLPYDMTFKSATTTQGSCWGGDWGYLVCDLGHLDAGASATITVVVVPNEGGTFTNYASVYYWDGITIDPDYSNNSAVETTTVKGPNLPVTVNSYSTRFYTALGAYVYCANDFVFLQGYLHNSYQVIYNEKSGFYMVTQIFNPQGITGEGLNTGDTYHATGMTRQSYRYMGGFPKSFTFENNFRIIGEKTGNDLLVHMTSIVTFNPDGTVKTEVSKYSFECK